ncbi:MAG TPA: SlyX family protein [Candidatus Saccharimonadales bacterium]|nr:SlyX family protein [Candidatus Saccharimonadales bacterium]
MNQDALDRLERLESHVAHLERAFDELNAAVVDQARTIRKLVAQQQRVGELVRNAELERIRSTNPKPPHYQ